MKEYLDMFLTFARVGVLTFGGGYAMLPILQAEVVEKKKWITNEEMMDFYAIGQCLPGLIAVAAFAGVIVYLIRKANSDLKKEYKLNAQA